MQKALNKMFPVLKPYVDYNKRKLVVFLWRMFEWMYCMCFESDWSLLNVLVLVRNKVDVM